MNATGADRMARVTRDNIGKPMAVVFIEDKFEFREVDGERKRIRTYRVAGNQCRDHPGPAE